MITVTRLDEYYHIITNKRGRIYYRLHKLNKLDYTPASIKKYHLILQALDAVMKMLRTFSDHDYISVDADGSYTISDNYRKAGGGECEARGKFDSLLGGMQG